MLRYCAGDRSAFNLDIGVDQILLSTPGVLLPLFAVISALPRARYHAPVGQGTLPARSAQLKHQAAHAYET